MSDIDKDLQRRLKGFADHISPEPGRSALVVRSARRKRRLVALSAGLAVLVAIGGLAGAATLLGDRDGIRPAPEPETLTEADVASMTVNELAAALFKDERLADAVPTDAGFSLREIIRHGPERTNHDYATVGVQMDGPVNYSRVIFFVHPNEEAATAMGIRRSELLRRDWKIQRDEDEDLEAFAVSNAPPATQCGIVYGQLLSCHAVVGRVVVLTQSGDEGPSTPQVTDEELDAATTLIRAFGSYLERVYPEHEEGSIARYFFEVAEGNASASGVLEVSSAEPSICLSLTSDNIIASHLLWLEPGRLDHDAVILTFFDPHDGEEGPKLPPTGPHCFAGEQLSNLRDDGLLQRLVDAPAEFRIDFHRGPDDEPGLIAELVPVGDDDPCVTGPTITDIPTGILTPGERVTFSGRCFQDLRLHRKTKVFLTATVDEDGQPIGKTDLGAEQTCELIAEPPSNVRIFQDGQMRGWLIVPHNGTCFGDQWARTHMPLGAGTYQLAIGCRACGYANLRVDPGPTSSALAGVRTLVTSFMQRRVEGAGAEELLDRPGRADFGPGGDLAPLYTAPPLQDFQIEFVDDVGNEAYEVGVSLVFQQGSYGETLFVRERDGELVISGGRPGLEGP